MNCVYLFEITINCKYGRFLTFLIENKYDIDLVMELTDYKRLLSEGILPLNYNRTVKYEEYDKEYIIDEILNYDQVLEKFNKYIELYESLAFHTDNFENLYVKDHENKYLRFKSISFDVQIALTEFYDYCESYYNISHIYVYEVYDDVVIHKNNIINRRRYKREMVV